MNFPSALCLRREGTAVICIYAAYINYNIKYKNMQDDLKSKFALCVKFYLFNLCKLHKTRPGDLYKHAPPPVKREKTNNPGCRSIKYDGGKGGRL